jgi:hypothetical protein
MESKKYIEDLSEIKSLMNKSSRFMSLSGLSGILAGVYALIGFFFAYRVLAFQVLPGIVLPGINPDKLEPDTSYTGITGLLSAFSGGYLTGVTLELAAIGVVTLLAAITTGVALTLRKAKKQEERIWNNASKRLLINFGLPLVVGGVFCVVLLQYGIIGLVGPSTLIFYGLALINASKYTIGDIKYLGLANVIIGLIATQYIGYGLFFWALGFGVFHIIYGARMYFKYDRD